MTTGISTLLTEKTSHFFVGLKKCEESGLPTYIYGAGEGANNVTRRASAIGFQFEGKIVDEKYYKENSGCECLEELLKKEQMNLVVAHRGFDENKLSEYRDSIGIVLDVDCFSGNYDAEHEMLTYEFVKDNEKELTEIYNSLADDKSRETLLAYINQKISMDYKYLKSVKADVQYFDPEIVKLMENEALVDAGAYVGDTVLSFIRQLEKTGINTWDAIYSFEPDPRNYKKLSELNIENFYTFMLATSDHKDSVSFLTVGKGSSSGITVSDENSIQIQSDEIDDVLDGKKVTFIKMDVEGYELASLKGARRIIENQRPKLAICIYHKLNDLWEIQKYIESVVDGYKYYIRAYEDTATELVLYAIP